MFEKSARLQLRRSLEKQFKNLRSLEQAIKTDDQLTRREVSSTRSTNERNMTRKTRSRQLRIHSAFQSGFCEVCHAPYNNLEDHVQSKRHSKLIGDDADFISIKSLDSFLALDGIDSIDYSPNSRRSKMPRTRASSVMCDRVKDSPMSPVGSDSGHRLRSRKNINYMTPPLEEDSLTEKPEVVKEFRELRSSTRLLAKLTNQMVESDEVWNSGRPKRACNRSKISADERLVMDNKSYYKVEVLSSKLRSGVAPFHEVAKRPETPEDKDDDKGLIVKFRKLRSSELMRLNNEAESFLFPKKDDATTTDDEDDDKTSQNSIISDEYVGSKKVKIEDDESMHSTSSESKSKKKRRTHAEAFIMDNQKYYKFETPGSRLRYQGSYLSPVPMKSKNNGDCLIKTEQDDSCDSSFKINLNEYNFSFESIPRGEDWFQTFERRDRGEEKYAFLDDENYWNPLILPYQLDLLPPIDPKECISQYNQIKKCLLEPPSTSTSVTCSTPDPNASNSSLETAFQQDEDSKISATDSASTLDELKPIRSKKRGRRPGTVLQVSGNSKNPRKSPRQHASTLAILSSLIQQRKRKSRSPRVLPTIAEEPRSPNRSPKKQKVDYFAIMQNIEEDMSKVCDECIENVDFGRGGDEAIDFRHGKVDVDEILEVYEPKASESKVVKRLFNAKPGRKPGKRKKNRTGWPLNRNRRTRREHVVKEEDADDSTVDSLSVNADSDDVGEENLTDSISNNKQESVIEKLDNNSENNNKNDQSSLGDETSNNCDLNSDRVGKDRSEEVNTNKVLANKVNSDGFNIGLQYQPYVRVQKLDKNHIDSKGDGRRSSSPKRTNRGQRRMPASPRSPRMLRRPRGRWYRER